MKLLNLISQSKVNFNIFEINNIFKFQILSEEDNNRFFETGFFRVSSRSEFSDLFTIELSAIEVNLNNLLKIEQSEVFYIGAIESATINYDKEKNTWTLSLNSEDYLNVKIYALHESICKLQHLKPSNYTITDKLSQTPIQQKRKEMTANDGLKSLMENNPSPKTNNQ